MVEYFEDDKGEYERFTIIIKKKRKNTKKKNS